MNQESVYSQVRPMRNVEQYGRDSRVLDMDMNKTGGMVFWVYVMLLCALAASGALGLNPRDCLVPQAGGLI